MLQIPRSVLFKQNYELVIIYFRFSIKNLGYIGLRSVDTYERLAIEKYNVPTFAMEDIDQ